MSTKQLSALLVEDGLVTPQQVEAAFQRQVLFGGRLGTNLLELGAIDEETLLIYLGRTSELEWAGRELVTEIDWEATELLDVDTIRAEKILPVRYDGTLARVLVTDRLSPQRVRSLEAQIGANVEQYITSEFRFHQLLSMLHDVPAPSRYQMLADRHPIEESPLRSAPSADLASVDESVEEDWDLISREIDVEALPDAEIIPEAELVSDAEATDEVEDVETIEPIDDIEAEPVELQPLPVEDAEPAEAQAVPVGDDDEIPEPDVVVREPVESPGPSGVLRGRPKTKGTPEAGPQPAPSSGVSIMAPVVVDATSVSPGSAQTEASTDDDEAAPRDEPSSTSAPDNDVPS